MFCSRQPLSLTLIFAVLWIALHTNCKSASPEEVQDASSNFEPSCYPGEDCSQSRPPEVDPGGTGGDIACITSPTGDVPVKLTQGLHLNGYDIAGQTIYAVSDGTVLTGSDRYGSWMCYSTGLCYGSITCPCVIPDSGPAETQCKVGINPHYTGGGYSYSKGIPCINAMCAGDACSHPERPCHNQLTLEFASDGNIYRFRALHIEKLLVKPGDKVTAGTPLAIVGNTGWTCSSSPDGTGNHGHVDLCKYDEKTKSCNYVTDWLAKATKNCASAAACKDGRCDPGENCSNCPDDCPCLTGLCQNGACVQPASCPSISWQRKKDMPASDTVIYGVGHGSKFHVFSGSRTNSHRAYDPNLDGWTPFKDVTEQIGMGAAASDGTNLYLVSDGSFGPSRILRYDSAADSWSSLASVPRPHAYPAIGIVGSQFIIAGSFDANNNYTGSVPAVEQYTLGSGTWKRLNDLNPGRGSAAFGVVGSELIVAGGQAGMLFSQTSAIDFATGGSRALTLVPNLLRIAGAVASRGWLVVLGGDATGGPKATATVRALNVAQNRWCVSTPLPEPLYGMATGWIDPMILVAGGTRMDGSASAVLYSGTVTWPQ